MLPSTAVVMPVGAALAVGRPGNSVRVEGMQRSSSCSSVSRTRGDFGVACCHLVSQPLTFFTREENSFIVNLLGNPAQMGRGKGISRLYMSMGVSVCVAEASDCPPCSPLQSPG